MWDRVTGAVLDSMNPNDRNDLLVRVTWVLDLP